MLQEPFLDLILRVLPECLQVFSLEIFLQALLHGISGNPLHISPGNLILGTVLSALILSGAAYVPRSMAKQGTVIELLHEKHIPIFRHKLDK